MTRRFGFVVTLLATVILIVGCVSYSSHQRGKPSVDEPSVAVLHEQHPLLGVDTQSDQDYPLAVAEQDGSRVMRYISHSLHAQAVGIIWDFCSASNNADSVTACGRTMSVADVHELVRQATANGLAVQLRPLIRVGPYATWGNPGVSWEGNIVPAKPAAWYRSLLATETPYLRLLRKLPGSTFVVTTEMDHFARDPGWPAALDKAHGICKCTVSQSAVDVKYRRDIFPPGNAIGVDWYPELHVRTAAPQATVTRSWEASLARIPASVLARTSMDEISIRATRGAYRHPQTWNDNGPLDENVQIRFFAAACAAAIKYHMAALYYYEIPLNEDPASPSSFPAYFAGQPGAAAIRDCARSAA